MYAIVLAKARLLEPEHPFQLKAVVTATGSIGEKDDGKQKCVQFGSSIVREKHCFDRTS